MAYITFTVRVDPRMPELLSTLAHMHERSVAELSREILSAGIRRLLDPEEIDRRLTAERDRLIAAGKQLQDGDDR